MTPLQVVELIKHCIEHDKRTFNDSYVNITADYKFSNDPEEKRILKEIIALLDILREELY